MKKSGLLVLLLVPFIINAQKISVFAGGGMNYAWVTTARPMRGENSMFGVSLNLSKAFGFQAQVGYSRINLNDRNNICKSCVTKKSYTYTSGYSIDVPAMLVFRTTLKPRPYAVNILMGFTPAFVTLEKNHFSDGSTKPTTENNRQRLSFFNFGSEFYYNLGKTDSRLGVGVQMLFKMGLGEVHSAWTEEPYNTLVNTFNLNLMLRYNIF